MGAREEDVASSMRGTIAGGEGDASRFRRLAPETGTSGESVGLSPSSPLGEMRPAVSEVISRRRNSSCAVEQGLSLPHAIRLVMSSASHKRGGMAKVATEGDEEFLARRTASLNFFLGLS